MDGERPAPHLARNALLVGASVVVAVSSCSAYGGGCLISVDLESPCGFVLVESTCSDGIPTCTKTGKTFTSCTIVPKSDCSIVVMLGDGTTQTVAVKVNRCVSPGFVSFASSTCVAPPKPLDAGLDASDANVDETGSDATDESDVMSVDATSD
jgi:hypothetical protein